MILVSGEGEIIKMKRVRINKKYIIPICIVIIIVFVIIVPVIINLIESSINLKKAQKMHEEYIKDTEKTTTAAKYNNRDYDGSYYFNYSADNGSGYIYNSIGYLVIDNGVCETKLHFNSSQSGAYAKEYNDGKCEFENNKLIIKFGSNSNLKRYICDVEDKNLNCALSSQFGFTGCKENNIIFEYKYNLSEFNSYLENYGLYLPENLRWNISSNELIEKYGTEKIEKAPNFNKELSWAHPLYSDGNGGLGIDIKEHTYLLSNDKLSAYFIGFKTNISQPYDKYKKIKTILSNKYGEPSSEKIIWTDETYKGDESKWNDAFRYNHFNILTTWNFSEYKLMLKWKYGDTMNIEYVLNGSDNSYLISK